ncbi:MAG: peptidase [Vicinamibacteria bacterium]|nr:peptidase [Vicinamibacteria bacterium]
MLLLASLLLAAAADAVPLYEVPAPDSAEAGSREAIAAATTEPRFLSPWVAYTPESKTVPSPMDFLGRMVGAPGELTRTEKIYAYYRALDAASDRVSVEVIGRSEEGREILLIAVGDAKDIARLDALRADSAALADPRRTDEAAMERIVASTRPFYMLHGGLHAQETGSPEMLMELAYRLAVSEAPLVREIRDEVVVLINPVAEPDGRDRQVDWFYKHLKGKTDYEQLPPVTPPYWGKYVFHDNNRDGVQRKLALTRATQDAFLKWHPAVVHDLHESIPLLSIWTGTGPYNPLLDPITTSEWHAIAFHEVTTLTSLGMPGVWTWGFGEGWGHFYADSVAINHNAIGRGYETFGSHTAETVERELDLESERYTGKPVTEPDWYRTSPPPKKFRWSLRNNVNYQQTGVLAALQYAARNSQDMLRHFWRRGRNSIDKGRKEAPYAIAIRDDQRDRRAVAGVVNLLREHGIEVQRASAAFKVKEGDFPAGTWLVRLDQPYRSYALDLLTPQKFPAATAPHDPYDDVAWDLPSTHGVEAVAVADAAVRDVAMAPVETVVAPRGTVSGDGGFYLLADRGQEALLEARLRLAKYPVEAARKSFSAGGVDYPAGSWVLRAAPGLREELGKVATDLALDFVAAAEAPAVESIGVDLPRVALLQAWADTQSAGWLRMAWDHRRVPYTLIMDEDLKRGGLRAKFDVIVYPNSDDSLKNIVGGIDPKFAPLAYTKDPRFPTLGSPTASDDVTGGFTWRGVQNLEDFVRQGGVLVTLGGASTLALDGGIARGVRRARTKDLYTPGSELRARFRRPEHPLAFGYPEQSSFFREHRPAYAVRKVDESRIVLQWGTELPKDEADEKKDEADRPKKPELVVSGGVRGGSELEGKPALLDLPTGQGRVIAFDFDPIHRYLTPSDFRLVWNAVLYWNDLPK